MDGDRSSRRDGGWARGGRALVIIALLSWGMVSPGHAQELPFAHYTPERGVHPLPSASISLVYQDQLGFLWISAFSSGLVRYDGHSTVLYTTADGLLDLGVQNLVEDAQGRLWAASRAGLVASEAPLRDYKAGRRIRFVDTLATTPLTRSSVRARAMALDEMGRLWVGTREDGLLRYDTRTGDSVRVDTVRIPGPTQGRSQEILSVAPAPNGSMWVGLGDGTLLQFAGDGRATVAGTRETFDGSYATSLYQDRDEVLWVGTASGRIYRTLRVGKRADVNPVGMRLGGGITDIRSAADSTVWVASEGGGLLRLDTTGAVIGHYTRANGLLNDSVTRIFQDREGTLWFAQLGGVSKLRSNFDAFHNYTATSHHGEQPVLPAPSVGAVIPVEDPQSPCRRWAATSGGGVACLGAGGTSAHLGAAHGLYGEYVNALAVDQQQGLWIGTTRGIQRFSFVAGPAAGRAITFMERKARLIDYDNSSVFSITVLPLAADGDVADGPSSPASTDPESQGVESIWFTHDGRLQVRMLDDWYSMGPATGLPRDRLHAVATDASGHAWVATRSSGVYRSRRPMSVAALTAASDRLPSRSLRGESIFEIEETLFASVWSTATGAATDEVYGMVWHEGLMWMATASGVVALSPDSAGAVAHLTADDGLGDDFSMSLSAAPATGTLWVGTNGGLTEIDPSSRHVLRTVVKDDGLADSEVWYIGSVRVDRDGTVLFGNAGGLTEYRPSFDRPSTVRPLLEMRNVIFAENEARNEINFEYAALTFVNESEVRYQTRLVGYDKSWSANTQDVRIRYTNLPAVFLPKTYQFEVRASNGEGVWTAAPLEYAFSVQPPVWLRWWAILLYAGVLAAGVAGVHQFQHARLVKRERERAQLREAELAAEAAVARSLAAEAQANALASENERKEAELAKARELEKAYSLVHRKNEENEQLLLNIFPAAVVDRLQGGESEIADAYDPVTILFADVVGFTKLASEMSPDELVHHLNLLFSEFDRIAVENGIEKIKTIGDAYMAAAGLPEARPDHAHVMAEMALAMHEAVAHMNAVTGRTVSLRIGLHSGPVTAGVIGTHKFAYDVWGDTVNTAARMESHGVPGRVHISAETGTYIRDAFDLDARENIEVKGKGQMNTYLIERRRMGSPPSDVDGQQTSRKMA